MYQQVTIIGNLGKDPILEYTQQGIARCKFSVATSETHGKGEQRTVETTWWNVTLWRETAEAANNGLRKGSKVMCIGRAKASAYLDKNGKPAASLELNANEFKFLDPKPEGDGSSSSSSSSQQREDPNDLPF